ncbi:MAG TPA: anti-sigma regulatory factor [Acidimicrobiales bacterium]|nr:anti-sigma regulatory factor [Acidimicrobiales bacterium]
MTHRRPSDGILLPISTDTDIVAARQQGRALAVRAGFTATELTLVATAISEVARNIVMHAGTGEMTMSIVEIDDRRGMRIVATDEGPGIDDIDRALEDGFTTGEGLGLGLPGARRLMDELTVTSAPGKGTTVVMHKWTRTDA